MVTLTINSNHVAATGVRVADAVGSTHRPVMVAEVLALLDSRSGGVVVDATAGAGGHALAMLELLPRNTRYVGVDLDAAALARARVRLRPFGERVSFVRASFRDIGSVAAPYAGRVTNCLFDLGLSSDQLDDAARGFSFRGDGPLDMRFNVNCGATAADVVNRLPERELADLFFELGQEPKARAVAAAVVAARRAKPLATTGALAAVVTGATGGRRGRTHAATRTFQALRIHVNDELAALAAALPAAVSVLASGGRLIVIAYHSLEDRIVKRYFREAARRGELEVITAKPLRPSKTEVGVNPRSRSARLRAASRA